MSSKVERETDLLPRLDRSIVETASRGGHGVVSAKPLPERVLQFGTGAFLRGFVDYFLYLANRQGKLNGSIVMVGSTGSGRVRQVNDQDGLYSLVVRGREGAEVVDDSTIVDVVSRALAASDSWNEVLIVARSPHLELIVSNTTEVGVRLDPDDRDNATNLMSLLTGRGLWQEAAPVVDRAIAAHPDDAWLLIERARTSYILRKASLALADLRRAIELEPTSNRANYFYALVLGEVESTEAGIEQMRRAMEIAREHPDIPLEIETNPSWTNSMAARIRVRLEEIFYEEGLEAAMAAGEDFLVECSGHEQIAAKLDQLREMKALDPEVMLEEQVALARAHERICRERHCDQRRLRAMLAIARLNPEDAHIRNSIAWMKADPEGNPEFRDLDGALLHSLRAVELSERQDPNILDTLAVIRFGLGQLDEAVALQEEIVRLMAGRDAGGYTFATAKAHLTRYRAALATKELNHEQ